MTKEEKLLLKRVQRRFARHYDDPLMILIRDLSAKQLLLKVREKNGRNG